MAKWHLTETGPKRCTAEEGRCPKVPVKGLSQGHYDDLDEAQAVFERYADKRFRAGLAVSRRLPQEELQRMAEGTASKQDELVVAEQGFPKALFKLAKNARSPEALEIAFKRNEERYKDPLIRKTLLDNPRFPYGRVEGGLEHPGALKNLAKNGGLTDEIAEYYITRPKNFVSCTEVLNYGLGEGLSDGEFNRLVQMALNGEKHEELEPGIWSSPKLDLEKALEVAYEFEPHYRIPVGRITDGETIFKVFEKEVMWHFGDIGHQGVNRAEEFTSNPNTGIDVIQLMAESPEYYLEERTTFTPNQLAIRDIMERLPEEQRPGFVASYHPAGQVELIRELSSRGLLPESSLDGGDGAREWHFDKDLVEEAGLERNDLDGWVRWDKGEYLLEPSYDKNTGIYRGFLS